MSFQAEKVCIGFGEREGTCGRLIDDDALALNQSGLWCVECEEARREYLTGQFQKITASFATQSEDGE